MPRRSPEITPALVVVIVLLCVSLIALGWWVMPPAPTNDRAHGPVTPGKYEPALTSSITTAPTVVTASETSEPKNRDVVGSAPISAQMLLGNPSGATPDPDNRDNHLMLKPYFAVAYNNSAGEPPSARCSLACE